MASGGAVRYGRDLAWICMILVDPGRRGRGLGTRVFDEVLARVIEAQARDGLVAVGLDATPAGRGLYAPRGFVDGPPLVRMRREGPAPATTGAPEPSLRLADGLAATRPMAAADLDAVLALDRQVFGANREAVLRDALASAPGLAHVAVAGGRVRGYCFGRHGDHSDHVGPVVAEDPAVARTLLCAGLAASRLRPVIVDARAPWAAALEALGFRVGAPVHAHVPRRRAAGGAADARARRARAGDGLKGTRMEPTIMRDTRRGRRAIPLALAVLLATPLPGVPQAARPSEPGGRRLPRRPRSSPWTSS